MKNVRVTFSFDTVNTEKKTFRKDFFAYLFFTGHG